MVARGDLASSIRACFTAALITMVVGNVVNVRRGCASVAIKPVMKNARYSRATTSPPRTSCCAMESEQIRQIGGNQGPERLSWYSPADSGQKKGDVAGLMIFKDSLYTSTTRSSSNSSSNDSSNQSTTTSSRLNPGEVQVRVKAVGLNFADVFSVLGLYKATPRPSEPGFVEGRGFIPGLEYAGIIEDVPPALSSAPTSSSSSLGLKVGDRVMGVTRFGAFSSRVVANENLLRRIPDSWSFEEGASFMVQGLTAIYGLRKLGNIQQGDSVLISSGAGGVGMFCLKICQALGLGASCVTTVSSEGKRRFLIDKFPWLQPQQGFDVVMDAIGGAYFEDMFSVVARGGRFVTFGSADFTPTKDRIDWPKLIWKYLRRPKVDVMALPSANKGVIGFNLIWMFDRVEKLTPLLDTLIDMELDPPHVGENFGLVCGRCDNEEEEHIDSFEDLPNAIRELKTGRTLGKVVVKV